MPEIFVTLLSGVITLPWWGYVVYTLVVTHITIACVTIYLHRHQAHSALDLHPAVSHFFRFWLWLTTGMVTKEWTAIHRKHHAKVETVDDPHSPQVHGLRKVLWQGAELYRLESRNAGTMDRFGHGTPDDWIEKNLYTRFSAKGVALLLIINFVIFGMIGITIWAVQMLWIPVMAAGIINGIGHYWGYRNFHTNEASRNIVPWGILIGGEELHNNHHAYGTSARLSNLWYELDIGWIYIRVLETFGLAKVNKTPPQVFVGPLKERCDEETLKAVIDTRFEVLHRFTRATEKYRQAKQEEIEHLRKNLVALWENKKATVQHSVEHLEAWCRDAHHSSIPGIQKLAERLSRYHFKKK